MPKRRSKGAGKPAFRIRPISRRGFFASIGKTITSGARAFGREFKPDLRFSRIKAMGRREALARLGIGMGAVLGARYFGGRKIREFFFPQEWCTVDFAFVTHAGRSNANRLRVLIESAILQKKPFHCMAVESVVKKGEELAFERSLNNTTAYFQEKWLPGKTQRQIALKEEELYRQCLDIVSGKGRADPEFIAQLLSLCIRYSLYFKAAEVYDPKEYEIVSKLQQRYEAACDEIAPLFDELKKVPLEQPLDRQTKEKLLRFLVANADFARYRNDHIRKTAVGLQDILRKENPRFKGEKPLRILCVAGEGHEKLFEDVVIENHTAFEAQRHTFRTKELVHFKRLLQQLVRFPKMKVSDKDLQQIARELRE